MGGGGSAGKSADGSAGILVPVGRAHPSQRRHEIYSAVIRHRGGQGLDFGGTADDSEAIPQPLDHRSSHEDGPFEGVVDSVAYLPGYGGEELVLGEYGFGAGVHQQEASGAVGVLDRSRHGAHLPEESGLLVARYAGDRNFVREDGGLGTPVDFGR